MDYKAYLQGYLYKLAASDVQDPVFPKEISHMDIQRMQYGPELTQQHLDDAKVYQELRRQQDPNWTPIQDLSRVEDKLPVGIKEYPEGAGKRGLFLYEKKMGISARPGQPKELQLRNIPRSITLPSKNTLPVAFHETTHPLNLNLRPGLGESDFSYPSNSFTLPSTKTGDIDAEMSVLKQLGRQLGFETKTPEEANTFTKYLIDNYAELKKDPDTAKWLDSIYTDRIMDAINTDDSGQTKQKFLDFMSDQLPGVVRGRSTGQNNAG